MNTYATLTLPPASRRTRNRAPGAVLATLVAAAILATSLVAIAAPTASASADVSADAPVTAAFTPVTPCRLLDSRAADTARPSDRHTLTVQVAGRCGIPATAVAISATLTAVAPSGAGHATVFAAGTQRPESSTLNFRTGEIRANAALTRLGNGQVSVYTATATDLLLDVSGYFVPAAESSAGRFVALTPQRLGDTRESGRPAPGGVVTISLPSSVPADAVAISINLTTTQTRSAGFFTAFADQRPSASMLNADGPGQTRAAGGIVPVSNRKVQVYTSAGDHVILDITGYFTGPSAKASADGLFVPMAPVRLADGRSGGRRQGANETITIPVGRLTKSAGGSLPPVAALAGNWTAVDTAGAGWWQAFPAGTTRSGTSTINAEFAGQAVANMQIVPVSTAGVSLYAQRQAHLVVDATGYFTGAPVKATPSKGDRLPETISSPDRGPLCAAGLDAASLDRFFAGAVGVMHGSDYMRATNLPDGRILWTAQDVFITGSDGRQRLIHNAILVQSGRCFTQPMYSGTRNAPSSFMFAGRERPHRQWWWPLDATVTPDGLHVDVVVAEMAEPTGKYLDATQPVQAWRARLRIADWKVVSTELMPDPSRDQLFGWSIVDHGDHSYLYGHCYQQWGHQFWFIRHNLDCTADNYLARVPKGRLDRAPEYWTSAGWSSSKANLVPVFTKQSSDPDAAKRQDINPIDVINHRGSWLAVSKNGDWWGDTVRVYRAPNPQGPWTLTWAMHAPVGRCGGDCNTYSAQWLPWASPGSGAPMFILSSNHWTIGATTAYRSLVRSVDGIR